MTAYRLVLKAYFDDSGSHKNSDITVAAGAIMSVDNWSELGNDLLFQPVMRPYSSL